MIKYAWSNSRKLELLLSLNELGVHKRNVNASTHMKRDYVKYQHQYLHVIPNSDQLKVNSFVTQVNTKDIVGTWTINYGLKTPA